ncbi:Hypothetical protein A7982_04586 [Minicystis rosea]|nr:Hypothetical protein A7982_04586 [Minicystis rosea]
MDLQPASQGPSAPRVRSAISTPPDEKRLTLSPLGVDLNKGEERGAGIVDVPLMPHAART